MHVINHLLLFYKQLSLSNMALLLCIDTSTTHASVALARNGALLGIRTNQNQKEHGAFLQPAIRELMQETGVMLTDLEAIAVTSGPGSYTGLRVGFASAKGLCFALNLPLISIPTTLVMSCAALSQINDSTPSLLCPMIDARRMEVFTCLYSLQLESLSPIYPKILDPVSFTQELDNQPIYFFGDGSPKWQTICLHSNARFLTINWNAGNMTNLAEEQFSRRIFTSLAHSVPDYGKDFHHIKI
jgi:tRNA threonylcarbamoyladenosine biosynthesis protein TsaB